MVWHKSQQYLIMTAPWFTLLEMKIDILSFQSQKGGGGRGKGEERKMGKSGNKVKIFKIPLVENNPTKLF